MTALVMAVVLFRWRQQTLVKKLQLFSYRETEELFPKLTNNGLEKVIIFLDNIFKWWNFLPWCVVSQPYIILLTGNSTQKLLQVKGERGNNTIYILQMENERTELDGQICKVTQLKSPGVRCPDAHKNLALSDLPKVTGEVCGRTGI